MSSTFSSCHTVVEILCNLATLFFIVGQSFYLIAESIWTLVVCAATVKRVPRLLRTLACCLHLWTDVVLQEAVAAGAGTSDGAGSEAQAAGEGEEASATTSG